MTYLVHINHDAVCISDDQRAAVETSVLAAVAAGGDFVNIPDKITGPARFLVTPATTVRIRPQTHVTDAGDAVPDLSFLDLDG